jgi:hypothetical protein
MCNCRGKLDFEVACKKCKRRTGALPTRYQAAVAWNEGPHPDPSSRCAYSIQSQDWGYEHVIPQKLEIKNWEVATVQRPKEPTYEFGWKYGDRPNFGSYHNAVLKLYIKDLEKYCDYLEERISEEK